MISAVIITKNEAAHIARCIQSLLPLTDDIIIIDSGSTDNTADVCKAFPVRFEVKAWQGFSAAKNYGNSLAKYHYILSIDGDEEVSEEMQESIRKLMQQPIHQAYDLPFLTNFCGRWIKHGAWYPETHLRIFDKNIIQWQGDIHEKLVIPSTATIGKVKKGIHPSLYHQHPPRIHRKNKSLYLSSRRGYVQARQESKLHQTLPCSLFQFL
jgi:Glycosyl transferase family 2